MISLSFLTHGGCIALLSSASFITHGGYEALLDKTGLWHYNE